MSKRKRIVFLLVMTLLLAALLVGSILVGENPNKEEIREVMKDAVLHDNDKISLFGIMNVNPGLVAAFSVTGIVFVFALIVRIFVIPKFKRIPGKFQSLLEGAVGMFDRLAKTNSPHRNSFLGAYVFTAGAYIFISTMFELIGIQAVTVSGHSISLPAPLSDINGAIAMGVVSYLAILSGGIAGNGFKGIGKTLKEFSLPISMSFRLFGALLSGALVTELVYHYMTLSYGLPIFVAIMFTMLHALIQAYVLTMLTALFYGEVSEVAPKKPKKVRTPKPKK